MERFENNVQNTMILYFSFFSCRLHNRLLHQGASAMDIVQQYIACIHCLPIIDPSCSILQPVIDVITDYVK